MNLFEVQINYILMLINNILFKFMSALTEAFDYSWSDTLVEQELKELESGATEQTLGDLSFNSQEVINHTFDNTLVVDGLIAKGF